MKQRKMSIVTCFMLRYSFDALGSRTKPSYFESGGHLEKNSTSSCLAK